jgi:hypothetical protein
MAEGVYYPELKIRTDPTAGGELGEAKADIKSEEVENLEKFKQKKY